jgi:hypothetical protein
MIPNICMILFALVGVVMLGLVVNAIIRRLP